MLQIKKGRLNVYKICYLKWARIVLVVERGVDPQSRLENQLLYSQPMVDGRRAFMLRQQQTEEDLEEMKELDEIRTTHKRSLARRAAKMAAMKEEFANGGSASHTQTQIPPSNKTVLIK